MTSMLSSVKRFVRSDKGDQAVTNVAILAVGAIVLLAVLGFWNSDMKTQIGTMIKDIIGGGSSTATQPPTPGTT